MSRQEAKIQIKDSSHQLSLIGNIIRQLLSANGHIDEARIHLKKMNEYFSPTDYIPCRGLYYDVYAQYYRITQNV